MSEEANQNEGSNNPSGNEVVNEGDGGSAEKGGRDYIPRQKYNQTLSENKANIAKLKEYQDAESKKSEEELLEQNKYAEVISQKETVIKDLKKQMDESKLEKKRMSFSNALEKAAMKAGAEDVKYLMMNMEDFSQDENGNFLGIEDKVNEIKETKSFLFKKSTSSTPEANQVPGGSVSMEQKDQFSDPSRSKIFKAFESIKINRK
jgi:hypothetical protein